MSQRPPQRPNPRPALQRPAMLGAGHNTSARMEESSPSEVATDVHDELMQRFETVLAGLQNDPALDRDMRDRLKAQFSNTVRDIESSGGAAVVPDRAAWMDTVQALQATGEIGQDEVNQLIRQINQALEPLQRRESQLAIEFSRRLQTEGQEKALAWFREESEAAGDTGDTSVASKPSSQSSPLLRNEVVNSRSRRLRGPPSG